MPFLTPDDVYNQETDSSIFMLGIACGWFKEAYKLIKDGPKNIKLRMKDVSGNTAYEYCALIKLIFDEGISTFDPLQFYTQKLDVERQAKFDIAKLEAIKIMLGQLANKEKAKQDLILLMNHIKVAEISNKTGSLLIELRDAPGKLLNWLGSNFPAHIFQKDKIELTFLDYLPWIYENFIFSNEYLLAFLENQWSLDRKWSSVLFLNQIIFNVKIYLGQLGLLAPTIVKLKSLMVKNQKQYLPELLIELVNAKFDSEILKQRCPDLKVAEKDEWGCNIADYTHLLLNFFTMSAGVESIIGSFKIAQWMESLNNGNLVKERIAKIELFLQVQKSIIRNNNTLETVITKLENSFARKQDLGLPALLIDFVNAGFDIDKLREYRPDLKVLDKDEWDCNVYDYARFILGGLVMPIWTSWIIDFSRRKFWEDTFTKSLCINKEDKNEVKAANMLARSVVYERESKIKSVVITQKTIGKNDGTLEQTIDKLKNLTHPDTHFLFFKEPKQVLNTNSLLVNCHDLQLQI